MDKKLFEDFGNLTGANGTTTFADSEAEVFVEGDVGDQFDGDGKVITGHDHFAAFGEDDGTGNVSGTEVELRTVVVVERSMAAAFFFFEDIDGSFEFVVRLDGAGFGDNHTATDFVLVDTTEEETYVVASFTFVEDFAEHFDTGDDGFEFFGTHTDDVNGIAGVDNTGFDTAGTDGTTTGDGEDVFDGHEEVLIDCAGGQGDIGVNSSHEVFDVLDAAGFAIEAGESGTADDGDVVAIIVVGAEELADFHFDEVEKFGVVNEVALVHENNQLGNTNLTCEKDVLAGLGHRTVGSGDDEDSTVHLGSTGNHVLHIVGVAGAVNVSIVTGFGLILNVSGVDGDTTLFLFGSGVDRIKGFNFRETFFSQHLGDSGGQSGLTVVNVADSTDVDVRFGTIKFFFCHCNTY